MVFVASLVIGVLLYQLITLVLLQLAWRHPRVPPRRTPADLGLDFEEVWVPTEHGRRVHGWWVGSAATPKAALVLIHGWGRNAERMLPYIDMLHPHGFDLLVIEARNHGSSDVDGTSSMKMFSEDIRAAARYLDGRGVPGSRCGVVGLSIGGSAAIHAACYEPRIAAVVTVGSFAHPADAMVTLGRWAWLLKPALPLAFVVVEWRVGARLDELAPERRLAQSNTRVLLIHGESDRVVPVDHARRLAAAGRERAQVWLIPGRGHSDPHLEPGFAGRIADFFVAALASAPVDQASGEAGLIG